MCFVFLLAFSFFSFSFSFLLPYYSLRENFVVDESVQKWWTVWSVCINRFPRRNVVQRSRRLKAVAIHLKRCCNDVDLWLGQRYSSHFHILSVGPRGPNHLTSDGMDIFQGIHECVLVACPGDDSATEKSESRTRSLMQPTIPFVYFPPVVLTISGAPPIKHSQFLYFHHIVFSVTLAHKKVK